MGDDARLTRADALLRLVQQALIEHREAVAAMADLRELVVSVRLNRRTESASVSVSLVGHRDVLD